MLLLATLSHTDSLSEKAGVMTVHNTKPNAKKASRMFSVIQ